MTQHCRIPLLSLPLAGRDYILPSPIISFLVQLFATVGPLACLTAALGFTSTTQTMISTRAISLVSTLALVLALGIHPRYLARNAPVPPLARAKGAFLLRHGSYMVDCAKECAMGCLNDPFTLANCFFQPDPSNPCSLLIVLRIGLRRGQLHELFVNYDKPYWESHAEYLPPDVRLRCFDYYNFFKFYNPWPDPDT